MNNISVGKIFKIFKILCIVFGVVFLLVACGDGEDGKSPVADTSSSAEDKAEAQKQGFTQNSSEDGSMMEAPKIDDKEKAAIGEASCWQGELLAIFYKPLADMALNVYEKLTSENIMNLMMLVFSLWMAFQILRHVASPSPESIGEFWTKVLRKGTLCFACGYLASSPEGIMYVLNTFVMPIYITLLELCGQVLDFAGDTEEGKSLGVFLPAETDEDGNLKGICDLYKNGVGGGKSCSAPEGSVKISTSEFPTEPLTMMSCMACSVSARLDTGFKVAMYALEGGVFGVLVGFFLIGAFFITKLGFAMYLVDSIFRLDMMVIIAPFLILFYPFEQTRKWTVTGFKIILNSSAIMLCLGVLVTMTIMAMMVLLSGGIGNVGDTKAYDSFGVIPISLIFLGFIVIKAAGTAVSLSERITGGGGDTKFQKKMAAIVGTVAKGLFAALTAGGGKIITTVVEHSQRLKAAAEKIRRAQEKVKNIQKKMQHMAGRDNNQGGEQ